jgi:DNA-binding response OmpR family regulator
MAHILLAEDDARIYRVIDARLPRRGHTLIWAREGPQALAYAQQERPDLILLDIMLPLEDGISMLRHLRSNPETASIPVIMLTALNDPATIQTCLEQGATNYVAKPFSFSDLLDRINEALASNGARSTKQLEIGD